jgi:hypothetical protein
MADCPRDMPPQFRFADVQQWFQAYYPSIQAGR